MLQLPDEVTLAVPHDAAENTRQLAREKLAAVGLRLNITKCMIYTASQVAPPGMQDWWEQTKTARRPHHSLKAIQHR